MRLSSPLIHDLAANRQLLADARYGMIETSGSASTLVQLRTWPTWFSLRELWPVGDRHHARGPKDRCRIFYNQSRGQSRYLALRYVVSTRGTSYGTFRAALLTLDAIAAIKRSDALLCDAANHRLSERFMARMGWQPHAPMRWRRNYIRRFYGTYPPSAMQLAGMA